VHRVGFSLHDFIDMLGQQNMKVHFDVQKNPVTSLLPEADEFIQHHNTMFPPLHYPCTYTQVSQGAPPQWSMTTSMWKLLSQTRYIQDIRISPSVDNTWRVNLTKLLMHSSLTSSLFLNLRSKYSAQHPRSQTPAIYVFRSGSQTTYHVHTKTIITI